MCTRGLEGSQRPKSGKKTEVKGKVWGRVIWKWDGRKQRQGRGSRGSGREWTQGRGQRDRGEVQINEYDIMTLVPDVNLKKNRNGNSTSE